MDRVLELLRYSPFGAREALRKRFSVLPARSIPRPGIDSGRPSPDDADVLRLLLNTVQVANCEAATAIEGYGRAQAASDGRLPDYSEAEARGWFRTIDGAVTRAVTLRDFCHRDNPPYAEDLQSFLPWLWQVTYQVKNPGTYSSAGPLEDDLTNGTSGQQPNLRSPSWVAARLWDADRNPDLSIWKMRWEILNFPPVMPVADWPTEQAQQFREAVLQTLKDARLPLWADINAPDGLLQGGDARLARPVDISSNLLERYLNHSRGAYGIRLFEADRLLALARQLILELPHIESGKVPTNVARALVDLAMRHPDLAGALVDCHDLAPQMLADLILCPPAAGLVCYLVATWGLRFPPGRDRGNASFGDMLVPLFEDCLEVLEHHLSACAVTADEYTSLLVALQERDARRPEILPLLPVGLDHLKRLNKTLRAEVQRILVAVGGSDAKSPGFQVLLKALAANGPDLTGSDAAKVAEAYRGTITSAGSADTLLLDASSAGALARVAFAHKSLQNAVIRPLDVAASLKADPSGTVGLGLALRTHIRFLCRAVLGYQETVPGELARALAEAVHSGACDDPARGQVDAFTFQLDFMNRGRLLRLEVELADAIGRFELPAQQTKVVDALLQVRDPLVLAVLLRRAPPLHRDRVLVRLKALSPSSASAPTTASQRQERVQAFLDAGLPDMAELYLQDLQTKQRGPGSASVALRDLYFQMNLHYQRGELKEIIEAKLPSDFPKDQRIEAQRALSFFLALTLLSDSYSDPDRAASILSRLHRETRDPLYAMNCLAARIAKLLAGDLFRTLSGEAAAQARTAIEEADLAVPPAGSVSGIAKAVHVPNCALMLLAIGRPDDALRRLHSLEPSARTVESIAYEAVANARLGEHHRALSLIGAAKEQYGNPTQLLGAESHILMSAPHEASVRLVMQAETDAQLCEAMTRFRELSASRQAEVLNPGDTALEELLKDTFRDAIAAFERAISYLHLSDYKFSEDDFNGLFAEFVEGRLEGRFGWQAHEQSPGGFTSAGNAGRRDFAIRKNGVDVAVFEALKSSQPNDARIKEHFEKLLAYSKASIFVHVTYSFRDAPLAEMFDAVERVARDPDGAEYVIDRKFDAEGARPAGIHGRYKRDGEFITVFFFVIDMRLAGLRRAVSAPQIPV